ncbi:MAG: hypothetical protein ACJ70Y_01585, partial [Nitrososphaera sp.]
MLRNNPYNYSSAASLGCIFLLLSGFIQYFPYNVDFSFDRVAYGQQQTIEVEHNRTDVVTGQEQIVDGKISGSSNHDNDETSKIFTGLRDRSIIEDKWQPTKEDQQQQQDQERQPTKEDQQ